MALFFGGFMKVRFMLLTRHTDEEINDLLLSEAEKGYVLTKNKGNLFYFKKSDKKRRVVTYSFLSRENEVSTEIELRRELPYLRKNGWDMITIGGAEDIADSRRHAFLIEEIEGAEIPKAEAFTQEKAKKRSMRKCISNLVLSSLYLIFLSFLFSTDLARISSSNLYAFFGLITLILFIASFTLTLLALINAIKYKKGFNKKYHLLDKSTLLTFITLLIILSFLLFDSVWSSSSHGIKYEINGKRYTLYNDDVPISLKDLGHADAEFKSSKHIESESLLAHYSYSYEQYLGECTSKEDFISYTLYSAKSKTLLNAVKKELLSKAGYLDKSLSTKLNAEVVRSKSSLEVMIEQDDKLLLIRSLVPLDDNVITTIFESLNK